MNNEESLNRLLAARAVPPASSNLSARITAAAIMPAAQSHDIMSGVFADIMTMLWIPRPAYALALSLFIGLAFGLQMDFGETLNTGIDWLSVSDIEEGNWL